MVQASTKSDAGKTNAWRFLAHLISSNTILPHSTSCSTVARKFMLTSYHGTSGPSGCIGSGPTPTQPASGNNTTTEPVPMRLEQLSQERLTSNQIKRLTESFESFLEQQYMESSVTKEKIDTLLQHLERLGLGVNDGDRVDEQESPRSDALLVALTRIEDRLRDMSEQIENVGSNGDTKIVSELMGYIRDAIDRQHIVPESSIPGESPPPPPRTCFGRDELIEEVIGLAENLTPVALVGAGGIGKTSIALTVLHRDRIRQRFGDSRRFIRCDQFPASTTHFLHRLSKVIGAGVENPEDLTPLRPFLSSREMILVLDNAESILDPKGPGAREIYAVVEELSRFKTISLCITSRISTVPRHCKRPMIPTLSMESASDIFHDIHNDGGRSDIIDNLLRRLDFHALSITLLATTASHNMWDYNRLAWEWDTHRVQVLQTDYDEGLAATIELSLASPTFRELGPSARDLLGVVAFFPQGIDENNIDWLFPTIPNRRTIFDKSCVLSLTYRSKGFTRMLAPLRDYLRPKDPTSSPLLHITKMCYFSRLSVDVWPSNPDFADTSWITSEDVNVEHLLDVFTTIDANSNDVWNACRCFMEHLYWHKRRLVMLGPKIEALPDDHLSKPGCLIKLSLLSRSIGNGMEYKRLLLCALNLWQERGDPHQIANTLKFLSDVNRMLGLYEEGIEQAREALEIYKWLNDKSGQAKSWHCLARLLHEDKQLDAAEEAASRAINLLDDRLWVCLSHRLLGAIYGDKGETEKAINHYETALGIASPFNWHDQQFWIHYSLADLFFDANRFDAAHAHVEHAKSHTTNDPYCLGRATHLRAAILYRECKSEEAQSEALDAADVFEKFGAAKDLERCRKILRDIEAGRGGSAASGQSDFNAWGAGHPSVNFEQLAPRPYEYPVPNHRAH